jgi:hypothetical protein
VGVAARRTPGEKPKMLAALQALVGLGRNFYDAIAPTEEDKGKLFALLESYDSGSRRVSTVAALFTAISVLSIRGYIDNDDARADDIFDDSLDQAFYGTTEDIEASLRVLTDLGYATDLGRISANARAIEPRRAGPGRRERHRYQLRPEFSEFRSRYIDSVWQTISGKTSNLDGDRQEKIGRVVFEFFLHRWLPEWYLLTSRLARRGLPENRNELRDGMIRTAGFSAIINAYIRWYLLSKDGERTEDSLKTQLSDYRSPDPDKNLNELKKRNICRFTSNGNLVENAEHTFYIIDYAKYLSIYYDELVTDVRGLGNGVPLRRMIV